MRRKRLLLRVLALGYLAALLMLPVGLIFYRTFEHGLGAVWHSITTPAAEHAFWLTIEVVAIAVPLNTLFGVVAAIALSPVVIGLSLLLLYGRKGWFGPWLTDHGYRIIFATPGIVLATIFVSL